VKVALGIPAYREQVNVSHLPEVVSIVASLLATQGRMQWGGFFHVDSACVAHARNHLVYQAIEHGADWLLMMDADTFCIPQEGKLHPAIPMLLTAQAHGAQVIAAPVRRRRTESYNAAFAAAGTWLLVEPGDFAGKVVEVQRAGTAYMAIDLNWLRSRWLLSPWFSMSFPESAEPRWIGEDFSFCDTVRERGGQILLDGRFEPEHR
jgi:hypothetical protein